MRLSTRRSDEIERKVECADRGMSLKFGEGLYVDWAGWDLLL